MPFFRRLAIFLGLWLLAGVTCAIFAEVSLEAGESEAVARLQLVFLTPLIAAVGAAFYLVQDHPHPWQRELCLNVVLWGTIACFVAHGVVMLTRRERCQFVILVTFQLLILTAVVSSVIRFYRHFSEVGW
jgi:uncharacterized membrane protein